MAKERKLGFVNCVSHPFSDSQGIPCSWQSSFISETLSSAFWKAHCGPPSFSSGSNPASLPAIHIPPPESPPHCFHAYCFIECFFPAQAPGSPQQLLPGVLGRVMEAGFSRAACILGSVSTPHGGPEPHRIKVLFAFASQSSLPAPLSMNGPFCPSLSHGRCCVHCPLPSIRYLLPSPGSFCSAC